MAKNDATRFPKRIAGIRLSKRLRRRGGRMLDFLGGPVAANLAAAALIAGIAALGRNKRVRRAAAEARDRAGKVAATAGAAVTETASEARRRAAKMLSDTGGADSARRPPARSRKRRPEARPTAH